jgi:hypothetical protein
MPAHLVERINASLAAEQAQRAATTSGASVTSLLAGPRRGPGRLMFAIAGAAAALVLVAMLSTNMFAPPHSATTSGSAAITSSPGESPPAAGGQPPPAAVKAPALADRGTTASVVKIGRSGIRYTQADFATQVLALRRTPWQPMASESPSVGPAGTAAGLTQCLSAIGATQAQLVMADIAFYDGRPAVIIVATTNGMSTAYAVGRQCSRADAAVLRGATPLS